VNKRPCEKLLRLSVASVNGGITPPPKIRRNTPEEWNSRSIAHFAISTRPIRKHGSEGQKAKGKEQKAKSKKKTTNNKQQIAEARSLCF
jgi:hypothetical protein